MYHKEPDMSTGNEECVPINTPDLFALEGNAPLVQVQIVSYNSADVLSDCLAAINNQSYQNFRVVVIDNASEISPEHLLSHCRYFQLFVQNQRNVGYAPAHNQGFHLAMKCGAKYVLTLNPDVVLAPDYLELCIRHLEFDEKAGGVSGKLLLDSHGLLDTTGIHVNGLFHAKDRGFGSMDTGQFDLDQSIIGVCGAAAIYRLDMLCDVERGIGQIFDERFVTYKEDVDLSIRALIHGWYFRYVPQAVAFHRRGWKPGEAKPKHIRIQSQLNQLSLLVTYHRRTWKYYLLLIAEVVRLIQFNGVDCLFELVSSIRTMARWSKNKRKIYRSMQINSNFDDKKYRPFVVATAQGGGLTD